MGDFAKSKTETFDPTSKAAKDVQGALAPFLQQFATNPAAYIQMFQNPAIGQAMQQMQGMQNNNPEQQALQMAMNQMAGGQQQFQNGFNELSSPFGDMGVQNRAEQTLMAALPAFDRNLQQGLTRLNTTAPNRFSSRLAEEGRDVTTQALQDYNLFANNALMQGQQLQSQERNQAMNFMLGARGLQQGAQNDVNQANLQGRANHMQGMGVLGQMAGQAGMNPFNRAMGMGQMGIDSSNAVVNPAMQFLQSMMGYAQPQQQQAIVHPSGLQQTLGGVQAIAGAGNLLGFQPFGNKGGDGQPGGK